MGFIDMKTLIFNQAVVYLVCTIVIGLLWRQNHTRFSGLGLWLGSFAAQLLSLLLIILRGTIPDWMSIVIGGNALPVGGALLMYVGLERFIGRRSNQVYYLALLVISMSIHAYFAFVHPNLSMRNVNVSFALSIIHVQTARLMLHRVKPEIRPIIRDIGIVFSAFVLVDVGRIVVNILEPSEQNFLQESSTIDTLLMFSYQILFFAAVFVLFLAVNRHLFLDLQTKHTELEAQSLELRRLWLAIENSGNVVVLTDKKGAIEYANPSFEKSSGYQLSEVMGKNPHILKSGKQSNDFYRGLWETITNGRTWRGEFHNRRKDGTLYWEDTTIAPVQDNSGQVTSYVAVKIDITERKQMEAYLKRLATTDALTSALNRRQITKLANREFERARRYHHSISVIILDIDSFKTINDQYGHPTGDLAAQHVARILRENLRSTDHLGRYGGDEFTIVMPDTDQLVAGKIAERLRSAVERQKLQANKQIVPISISLGVACISGDSNDPLPNYNTAIQLADKALYAAKRAGRNCFRIYNSTEFSEESPGSYTD